MLRNDQVGRLVGVVALALLVGALGFQYLGQLQPCPMCHWQRWAHAAAATTGLLAIPLWKKASRPLAMATILFVAVSGLIAAYQVGEQLGIFAELEACKVDHPYRLGSTDIPAVSCAKVTWSLFGLSMAAYNALFSLSMAGLGTVLLAKARKRIF